MVERYAFEPPPLGGLPAETLDKIQRLIELIGVEVLFPELPGLLMPHLIGLFRPDVACVYVQGRRAGDYLSAAEYPDAVWSDVEFKAKFGRRPASGGAIGRAVENKGIVFVDDPEGAESRGEYVPFAPDIANEIVVPILSQDILGAADRVVALLIMSRRAGNEFSPDELRPLRVVSSLIGAIFNNSLARSHREKRIKFLRSVTELQTADLDVIFQNLLTGLAELVPSRFISLWLYNELDNTLVIRAFQPPEIAGAPVTFESLDTRVMRCSESLSGIAVESKRPMIFPRATTAERFQNHKFAAEHDLDWFVCVPVLDADGDPLGVVNLWPLGEMRDFTEKALETLFSFISPVANTIRLASLLFEEDLLFAYDEFFSSLIGFQDHRGAWDRLAALIRDRMRCEGCSIFLLDPDGLLRLKGTTGLIGRPDYDSVVYVPGEGLTGSAFTRADPIIYYPEARDEFASRHISKFREEIAGKSKSIIFTRILDAHGNSVGVMRCNNKEESPARHVGRFTKEDVLQLQKIANVVSSLHSKSRWLRERERERERNLNSLQHELLSPLEGITAHVEWMEYHFNKWKSFEEWDMNRLRLKFGDMKQNAKLIDMVVTTMGRLDENVRLRIRDVPILQLLEICKGFLINEADRKGVRVQIDSLYVSRIRGDELQLMRLFYNLLRNAIKYSDPREPDKFIRIYISANLPDRFTLSFSDNGIGVPPGEEERIFRMFERGSNAASYFPEGSGMGLAFCRAIMRRHGGEIRLDSHGRSKPTVFHLTFAKKPREVNR